MDPKKFCLLFCVTAFYLSCGGTTPPTDLAATPTQHETLVRQTLKDWITSLNRGDSDSVLLAYDDDAVLAIPGRGLIKGKEAIRSALEELLSQSKLELSFTTESIELFGDRAVLLGRYMVRKERSDGQTEVYSGNSLSILRDNSGRWFIRQTITNSDVPNMSLVQ